MNLDRTIGDIFLKWPTREIRRLFFVPLSMIVVLVILIWLFNAAVKAQTGVFLRRLFAVPAAMTIHPPLLSDPLIDRLAAGAQMSSDGRLIVYTEKQSLCSDPCPAGLIVEDAASGTREIASSGLLGEANDSEITDVSLGLDGRFVAYASPASNLVEGDTNAVSDIFLYDVAGNQTRRISLAVNGAQAAGPSYSPAISADGRIVAFVSYADNLVYGDTNGRADVYLVDLEEGTTRRLSVDASGRQIDSDAHHPAISGDGKTVVFSTSAENLVDGDTNAAEDVFLVDVEQGKITRLSMAGNGGQADGDSFDAAISSDGLSIAYASYATNLTNEKNRAVNVFLYDVIRGVTSCVSCDLGRQGEGQAAWKPRFAPDGRLLLFDVLSATSITQAADHSWQVYGYDSEHDLVYRLASEKSTSTAFSQD